MSASLPPAVVVFGASGFIGRNLVEALAARGIEIFAVNRTGALVPGCRTTVSLDRLDEIPDLPDDTIVVNVAAHRYDAGHFEIAQSEILMHNAVITGAVFHFCVARGIAEVRLASSVAVYPAALNLMDDETAVDLNAPPHASEAAYAWSKRWIEICAGLYRNTYGINTLAFRLTNPYGPQDSIDVEHAHVVPAFIVKALAPGETFEIRGNPHAERDFIYVGDVVEVFVRSLARQGENAVYNLGTGAGTTIETLAKLTIEAAGVDKKIRLANRATSGVAARRATVAKLRQDFGIERFVPLREGLRHTIEWYRHALDR